MEDRDRSSTASRIEITATGTPRAATLTAPTPTTSAATAAHWETRPEGVLRIPAPAAQEVAVRFASLDDRDRYDPERWRSEALAPSFEALGEYEIDLNELSLPDGAYEYEFVIDGRGNQPVADPFAEEITRFGNYRGIFHVRDARLVRRRFDWGDELRPDRPLPGNHQMVIYEMPMRWMSSGTESAPHVALGTFENALFGHLDELEALGVNAIELLPVQDSSDTLNWGYGTRFFFAPDLDMGSPVDLKFFIKGCHRRGIRVILDVVMNHSRLCPLEVLARDWYYLKPDEEPGRWGWGGQRFRYRDAAPDGRHLAREFHYRMAEFWVREYHVDGFRIDEFKGIDHWEFVQTFRERAARAHRQLFPDRPFVVIAEDSWRRAEIVHDLPTNPGGRKVVDAMWNFSFRDELRRLLLDQIQTRWGEPSRRERVEAMLGGGRMWDDLGKRFRTGFADMAQPVNYITSHDVEQECEQRLMNYLLGAILLGRGLGDDSVPCALRVLGDLQGQSPEVRTAHRDALDRVGSAFALMLTSVGTPMFLAGEEFADIHDFEHRDWTVKMCDPINWDRQKLPGHRELRARVADLIKLRKECPALQRNELEFFHVHPTFDQDGGERVFAYCRTAGLPLGARGQVVVLVNAGSRGYSEYHVPWFWPGLSQLEEHGAPADSMPPRSRGIQTQLTFTLAPFQVRVFTT